MIRIVFETNKAVIVKIHLYPEYIIIGRFIEFILEETLW